MTKVFSFNDDLNFSDKSVVTFGNFDGIHLGHAELISNLIEKSKSVNAKSVLITFNNHTKQVLCEDSDFKLITPFNNKIKVLKTFGLDYVVVIDFDEKFSKISAVDFTKTIISKFNPAVIFLGYDNKFGYKGQGNIEFLREYLNNEELDINVVEFDEFVIDNRLVKSSIVKNLILKGAIDQIKFYLAKNLEIDGTVVEGKKIGSKLGFPTANIKLKFSEQILPNHGVYYVNFKFDRKNYKGLCNIGYNPTFNSDVNKINIETYLLIEKEIDLYGKEVSIEFIKRIRSEKKFNSKDELINQIKNDIKSIETRSDINNG
tara:strand:- start:4638 stop:5588 length:951 start_codon:yes stop_codon:yes gene_type:complete